MTGTPEAVRTLLERADRLYADDLGTRERLGQARRRLDEPLRVAVAGKVKAGKSTLLNALLGEQIAATDAGECTLVTTWYRYGAAPSAAAVLPDGRRRPLLFRRAEGRPVLDLDELTPAEIGWIEVTWPLPFLQDMTLIDTPGIGSLTREASARTLDLVRAEEGGSGVDALVYLMRHRHAADLELLQGFHADTASGGDAGGSNVIGVLSRADELVSTGVDAMLRAQELANAYAQDPAVRDLCRGVLPMAGLLAQGAQTMTHDEYVALRRYAELPKDRRDLLTLSASRFAAADDPDLDADARHALLERLGLFGIKLGASLVRMGIDTPDALAGELTRRSGLPELRDALLSGYGAAADLFRARSAVQTLIAVLSGRPRRGSAELLDALDDVVADAWDLRELQLTARVRRDGLPGLDAPAVDRALALLRGSVAGASADASVTGPAGEAAASGDLTAELGFWRSAANDPLLTYRTRETAAALGRLVEHRLTEAAAS